MDKIHVPLGQPLPAMSLCQKCLGRGYMDYPDTQWRVGYHACAACGGVGHVAKTKKEPTA